MQLGLQLNMQPYIDLAGELFVAIDLCGRVTQVNQTACQVLGYTEDEVVGQLWFEQFLPPRIRDSIEGVSEQLLGKSDSDALRCVNPVLTRSGNERMISWRNMVLRDDGGQVVGHMSFGEDITDRLMAERANLESEAMYRKLFDEATQCIMVIEIERQRVVSANPAACSFFGYSMEEMLQIDISQMHPMESLEDIRDVFFEHVNGQREETRKLPYLRKDGRTAYANIKTSPVDFEGTRCLVGYFTDVTEQVAAEEVSRKSDEKYYQLVETARHGIQENDVHGTITFCNQACDEVYGCPHDELVGSSIWDRFAGNPQELEDYLAYLVKEQPAPTPYINQYVAQDGRLLTLQVDWDYQRDPDGVLVGFVSVITDITEQVRADEALRDSENRFQMIMASLHKSSVTIYDREGRITAIWADDNQDKVYGLCHQDIIGKRLCDLLPEDEATIRLCQIEQVLETGESMVVECHYTLPNGKFWVESSLSPISDCDGNIMGVVGFGRDVTDRMKTKQALQELNLHLETQVRSRTQDLSVTVNSLKAEAASHRETELKLRESEEIFRTIVETSTDWVWEKNIAFAHTYSNHRVQDILGFTIKEIKEIKFSSLFHPDEASMNLITLQHCASSKTGWSNWIKRIRHKDGEYRFVESNATPVLDSAGDLVGFRGVDRDITQRVQAERELEDQKNNLAHVTRLSTMGATVSGLAHELNQPLSALTIYADACARMIEPKMHVELSETLSKIANQAERAGKIIHRVQQFTRKGGPHQTTYSISELIHESVSFVKADAKQHDVRITLELSGEIPLMVGDPIQVQQVIMNLIRNGVDSMRSVDQNDRVLNIRSFLNESNMVTVVVQDCGAGFSADIADQIFESFFTTKPDGMGLGLSISRSIIESHGGQIVAACNADRGASFTITLPVRIGAYCED